MVPDSPADVERVLRVEVEGNNPDEIEEAAKKAGREFFGDDGGWCVEIRDYVATPIPARRRADGGPLYEARVHVYMTLEH